MVCKYCGAQIAPGKLHCLNIDCVKQEILDALQVLSVSDVWACFAMACYDSPEKLCSIDRITGEAAISALHEHFSDAPEKEQAVEWVKMCMEKEG